MNILGIGTDIVSTVRISKIFSKNQKFAKKILSDQEFEIFKSKHIKHKCSYLAKRFCAKEALMKASSLGWQNKISFKNISILNNNLGKPYVKLSGQLAKKSIELGIIEYMITISDEKTYAIATAITLTK